jgi:GAF domain-containing protein
VSRYELRDISDRLARSTDAEAVAFEFLGALQESQPQWRATLAFYEVSRDALVRLYEREKDQLKGRDIKVMVDQLPPRMIRNFFHPTAALEPAGRKSILTPFVQSSPMFEPDLNDAVLLRALLPVTTWSSCVCLPLMDRGEMLAVLTIVSSRRAGFGPKVLEDLAPLRSMAAFALAERLHRATASAVPPDADAAGRAVSEFHERIEQLTIHARELEQDKYAKENRVAELTQRIEQLDQHSNGYLDELQRVKQTLAEIEQRSDRAVQGVGQASAQLETAGSRLEELQGTQRFMSQVFESLAAEHDPRQFSRDMVRWLTERFGVERCSIMLLDRSGYLLRIVDQSGIPPEVAERVRVRLGQGVAGWVALHRKPLFVQARADAPEVERNTIESYDTESFVCVPIVYNGRITGVLNLSNKKDGTAFTAADLDRATFTAGVLAITLGSNETVRRALAWAA